MHRSTTRWLAVATSLLGLCGGAAAADFQMRLSHQYPPAHPMAKAMETFAADVKQNTGGKVEVQVFGAEQLYKATQNHAAVARGQIESAAILTFQWASTVPEMALTTIPYLFTHAEQLRKFPSSEAAAILNRKMEAKGVKPIAWLVDANDGIFTSKTKPLIKPDDFKGIKVRGISKLFDTGLSALGAQPSAMPGSEVYQALDAGVLDAGLTGVGAAYSRRFYEVQKYAVASTILTAHLTLVVNPAFWTKLGPALQQQVQAAARKAETDSIPDSDDISPRDLQNLRDKGMNVTVLTKEQERAMAAVMQPAVIKAYSDSAPEGAKLVELIKKM